MIHVLPTTSYRPYGTACLGVMGDSQEGRATMSLGDGKSGFGGRQMSGEFELTTVG